MSIEKYIQIYSLSTDGMPNIFTPILEKNVSIDSTLACLEKKKDANCS